MMQNKVTILHNNNNVNNKLMSIMYESLNKNECETLGSSAEGMKKGVKVIQCDWLLLVRQRYQGVSYWVVA